MLIVILLNLYFITEKNKKTGSIANKKLGLIKVIINPRMRKYTNLFFDGSSKYLIDKIKTIITKGITEIAVELCQTFIGIGPIRTVSIGCTKIENKRKNETGIIIFLSYNTVFLKNSIAISKEKKYLAKTIKVSTIKEIKKIVE